MDTRTTRLARVCGTVGATVGATVWATVWATVGTTVGATPGFAAEPGLPAGLRACTTISVDTERLACFDREVRRSATPTAATTNVATAAAVPVLTPEERFGLSNEQINKKAAAAGGPDAVRQVSATVTATRPHSSGGLVIELDNGQQWLQTDKDAKLMLKPGSQVTIKSGAIGSFWLSTTHRGAHVRRIR